MAVILNPRIDKFYLDTEPENGTTASQGLNASVTLDSKISASPSSDDVEVHLDSLILSTSPIQLSGATTNEVSSGFCSFLPTSLVAHDTLQDTCDPAKASDTTATTNENIDGESLIVSPALSSSSLYLGSISASFRQIKK